MPNIKRTFSIPDMISQELDAVIPSKERSKFISQTLQDALKRKKKERLLEALEGIKPVANHSNQSSEAVLRTLREERIQSLVTNNK